MTLHQQQISVKTASGLDVVVGLWLLIAPFALDFTFLTAATWNSIIFGILITLFAASRAAGDGYKLAWPSWINAIIGIWLIISPFVLGFTGFETAYWNTLIIGVVVTILATWSSLSTPKTNT